MKSVFAYIQDETHARLVAEAKERGIALRDLVKEKLGDRPVASFFRDFSERPSL